MRSRSNSPGLNFDNDRETFNFAERAHHQITASPAANSRVSKLLVRKVRARSLVHRRAPAARGHVCPQHERTQLHVAADNFSGFFVRGARARLGGRREDEGRRRDRRADRQTDAVEGSDSPKAEAALERGRKKWTGEGQDLASEQRCKMHAPAQGPSLYWEDNIL